MTIEPEVRQAILMFRYFVNHSMTFDQEQEITKECEKNEGKVMEATTNAIAKLMGLA